MNGSAEGSPKWRTSFWKNINLLVKRQARTLYLIGGENEDLIQEGMIGLYKAIRTYRPGESAFASYAQVCVNRQMYTAVQASGRKKHEPLNEYISLSEDLNLFLLDNPEIQNDCPGKYGEEISAD